MAAPQIISLGIGSPADIPNFLTFGLSGAEETGFDVPLDLCAATIEALGLPRHTRALNPDRRTVSLVRPRRTKAICS
jgi:hypothetical protein